MAHMDQYSVAAIATTVDTKHSEVPSYRICSDQQKKKQTGGAIEKQLASCVKAATAPAPRLTSPTSWPPFATPLTGSTHVYNVVATATEGGTGKEPLGQSAISCQGRSGRLCKK